MLFIKTRAQIAKEIGQKQLDIAKTGSKTHVELGVKGLLKFAKSKNISLSELNTLILESCVVYTHLLQVGESVPLDLGEGKKLLIECENGLYTQIVDVRASQLSI